MQMLCASARSALELVQEEEVTPVMHHHWILWLGKDG
jgi:hypothetical protein